MANVHIPLIYVTTASHIRLINELSISEENDGRRSIRG